MECGAEHWRRRTAGMRDLSMIEDRLEIDKQIDRCTADRWIDTQAYVWNTQSTLIQNIKLIVLIFITT